MPKIFLKPNSADFADDEKKSPTAKRCDMPGCAEQAEFKAPKDRSLSEYYTFCLEHVSEYNRAWDFFSGMSMRDIEDHVINSIHGDRPTRRYDNFANLEMGLKTRAWQYYHYTEKEPESDAPPRGDSGFSPYSPEYEALAIMELQPPVSREKVKERYKALVKKYHPDINGRDPKSEELLKRINMAYTILKLAYEKFEKLDK